MSNYSRGRRLEWKFKKYLEGIGFVVFRCAGSKPVDLIALSPEHRYLVECKSSKISKDELERKLDMAFKAGCDLMVAVPGRAWLYHMPMDKPRPFSTAEFTW